MNTIHLIKKYLAVIFSLALLLSVIAPVMAQKYKVAPAETMSSAPSRRNRMSTQDLTTTSNLPELSETTRRDQYSLGQILEPIPGNASVATGSPSIYIPDKASISWF